MTTKKYAVYNEPQQALNAVGLDPYIHTNLEPFYNKVQRVGTIEKPRSTDGYVILFTDGNFLCGNWNGDLTAVYCKKGKKLSKTELDEIRASAVLARIEHLQELETKYKTSAKKALKFWQLCKPINPYDLHPYLTAKLLKPVPTLRETTTEQFKKFFGYELKEKDRETPATGRVLVVPLKYKDSIASLQLITETGAKTFLAGGRTGECYWLTEKEDDRANSLIAIGEGMATMLAVVQEGWCHSIGVASMSASNLPKVAKIFRKKYPDALIVIYGDNDKSGTGQRKAIEAQRSINGSTAVEIPDFFDEDRLRFKRYTNSDKDPTDWADLHIIFENNRLINKFIEEQNGAVS